MKHPHISLVLLCFACSKSPTHDVEEVKQLQARLEQTFEQQWIPSPKTIYPPYYKGSYIDKQGCLVIQIVGDTLTAHQDITTRIGEQGFRLERSWYSPETIQEVYEQLLLLDERQNRKFILDTLKWYSTSPGIGTIQIGLGDCSPENIALFKQRIMDSPVLCFKKATISIAD